MGTTRQGARLAKKSQPQHSQEVAKRSRAPSVDAGSSKKKTRREPATEVPSQETLLAIDPEPVHAGSPGEDFEAPLLSRSIKQRVMW